MIGGSPEKHKVHEAGAHVIHKYYKIINTHYKDNKKLST